jgi:transmembrane sensor
MENEFSQLASKVLAGEASADEKKVLKQMLLENTEHSLIYNQLKEYWDADVKLTGIRDKDTFEANLLARLDFEPEAQVSNFRKLYLRIASAAAILFFVMTCSLAYLYIANPYQESYTYAAQSVPVEYTLKDGTKVTLNKNSSLTFKSDFGDKRRDVKLVGNAYFKVSKDKTRPFSVEALGTKTEVLGTSFNIETNEEKSEVSTTLVEGSVHFTAHKCDVLLHPGEEVIYDTSSGKHITKKVDTQYNTAWVSGRYNYKNIKFADLIAKLEKIYNIKIQISNQGIENQIISASFIKDEPIEEILNALDSELGFKYNIVDSIN